MVPSIKLIILKQDYIKDLEDSAFELDEKTTQLEQAEKEKEDIIQLFEDKIKEKEEDLEKSILERSELEGKAKETEVELSRTRSSNNTLDHVKKSLEQQVRILSENCTHYLPAGYFCNLKVF